MILPLLMKNNKIILIPVYNEENNIKQIVNSIFSALKNIDILFINGHSSDKTGKITDELARRFSNIKVIHENKKEGLASSYIKGFKYAIKKNYNFIIQMDADRQHNPSYIPKMLDLALSCDIVLASRDLSIKNLFKAMPIRKKASILSNIYANLLTRLNLKDTLSGFKCFTKNCVQDINWDTFISKGFIFQTETVYKIKKQNKKIKELPIIFYPRKKGRSKMSFKIFTEAFFKIIRITAFR
jgi:dolichol-phosphate mannosyltransferase